MIKPYKNNNTVLFELDSRILVIDLMRILCATAVFLFHYDLFAYGYLGVDIFFFISGFVLSNSSNKSNSLQFIQRRIQRISYSLVTVICIFTLLFFIFTSKETFKSVLLTATFGLIHLSNFELFMHYDYFAKYSSPNPFLHLWSISTEFQFYIIFFFLVRMNNYIKNIQFITYIALIVYLILNYYLSKDANIYLIGIDRFFEFCLGSFASILVKSGKFPKVSTVILLLCSAIWALITLNKVNVSVVIGTFFILIIYFKIDVRLYSNKILKLTANSTYEFYLIHFPVKILVVDYFLIQKTATIIIVLFFITWVISILLYYVFNSEIKINLLNITKKFNKFFYCLLVCLGVVFIFYIKSYLHESTQDNKNSFAGQECEDDLNTCGTKGYFPRLFLYGDSNARQLVDLATSRGFGVDHHSSHCIFDFCVNDPKLKPDHDINISHLGLMAQENNKPVIIGYLWSKFFNTDVFIDGNRVNMTQTFFGQELAKRIIKFASGRTGAIILFGEFPGTHYNVTTQECLLVHVEKDCLKSPDNVNEFNRVLQENLAHIKNLHYVNPSSILCKETDGCINTIMGDSIYKDSHHLSQAGIEFVLRQIMLVPLKNSSID
jgi:peptidoglycan/LPS O-acetylase OafA/YrhL